VFNHANIRVSPVVDRSLRRMIVTPDMHRIHHSVAVIETDSNYGFVFPWWDRLFGTYRENPAGGQVRMVVGLEAFRARRDAWLDRLLINPLCSDGRTAPAWPKNSAG
jgi:sterol desaturase/sphingolipid hydroxylase (fatty acid hydroxylase superfamily)